MNGIHFNINDLKSQDLKKITFPEFLELLDLLSITEEGITLPDDGSGVFIMESDEGVTKFVAITKKFPELFDDDVNKALEEFQKRAHSIRKQIRFALAKFSGTYSADSFEWTKCPLRIDVEYKDKRPIPLEEIIEFVKQLPTEPTAILKTIKGWHIFYITSDRISANDKTFKTALEEFKDTLLSLKSKYPFIDAISVLYNVHTRYSDEIYLLSEPKSRDELLQEFKKASVVYDEKETYFVIPKDKVSPTVVELIFNSCPILVTLEQEWENHDYNEWLIMAWKYCFFAHTTGAKEKYKQEFIEKSFRWKRGVPDLKKIEYQFEAEYRSMDVGGGYKIMGCKGISSKACRFSHLCEECPHAEWDYDERGEKIIKSNIVRKIVESLSVPSYKLNDREGWWYYYEGEKPTPVCKWFIIEDIIHFRSPEAEKSFIKIRTREGTDYIDYNLTTGGNIDYSAFNTLEILHTRKKEFKTLFETLIDKFKLSFGSRVITKVGYYYEKDTGKWRIVVANKDRYKPEDISCFMYNTLDYDGYSYIPSVRGNFEIWKAAYKEILKRGDPVLLEMIGFSISHLTAPYMQKKGFKKRGLNTLFFLRGSSGSGKTTRLKIAAALFGTPAVIDISETTITKIERDFGNYKTPLMLDEVKVDDDENRHKLKKLVYLIANRGMKSHAYGTFRPIDVPVVIAGEDKHLPIEQMLMEGEGLYRRALVLLLDDEHVKQYRNLMSFYINILEELEEHHGFAFKVLDFIIANEKAIRQKSEEFKSLTLLQDALKNQGIKEEDLKLITAVDDLLARIMFSLWVFAMMLGLSEEEWENIWNRVVAHINKSLAVFYKEFLPREDSIEEEAVRFTIDFTDLLKQVKEGKNGRGSRTIKNRTLKVLTDLTGVKINNPQVLKIVKDVLFKYYPHSRMYRFVDSVLVERVDNERILKEDIERLLSNISRLNDEKEKWVRLYVYINTAYSVLSPAVFSSVEDWLKTYGIDVREFLVDRTDEPPPPPPPLFGPKEPEGPQGPDGSEPQSNNNNENLSEEDSFLEEYFCNHYHYVKTPEKPSLNSESINSESKKPATINRENGESKVETEPAEKPVALPTQQTKIEIAEGSSLSVLAKSESKVETKPVKQPAALIVQQLRHKTVKTELVKPEPVRKPEQVEVKISANLPTVTVELIRDFSEIKEKLNYDTAIYFDVEADMQTKRPILITLYQEGWKSVYALDLRGKDLERVREWLLRFRTLSGYGLNYDLVALGFSYKDLKDKDVLDLLLLAKEKLYKRYINGKSEFSLDKVLKDVLKVSYPFDKEKVRRSFREGGSLTKEQLLYAGLDVFFLPRLQKELLKGGLSVVQELDQSALKVCVEVSQLGMPFLKEKALERYRQCLNELEVIKKELKFNPLSPQQVRKALMLETTKEEILREYILNNGTRRDIAEKVLRARKLSKEVAMIEAYLKHGDRVKGTFWTTGAISGRMSCNEENLQQVPRGLRDLFGFPEGSEKVLIVADFPQIELRLAGAIWKEPKFVRAFKEGKDLHKLTASIIYNKPLDDVTKEERQTGKAANFGLIYGISVEGFRKYCISNGIHIDENMAKEIKRKFFESYTQIAEKHRLVQDYFKRYDVAEDETWLGRKYVAKTPQEMLNYQIQGSGAELFKRAITELKRKYSDIRIINLVHDEIVIEADRKDAEEIANIVKEEMQNAWSWCVDMATCGGKDIERFELEVEPPHVGYTWEKD